MAELAELEEMARTIADNFNGPPTIGYDPTAIYNLHLSSVVVP